MKVKQYEVRMEMEVGGIASYSMLLLLTMQAQYDDGRRDARYMRQKVSNLWLYDYPSLLVSYPCFALYVYTLYTVELYNV